MSFNFSELQQKADKVLHNSDEFVRKWVDFISAPAGNVTLEYYDQNGNLKTAVFSNKNKLVQDFIANVNSAMEKTFYVDPMNGNDANDGSSSAPFKTPKKAIDSIPIGGSGKVFVHGDIVIDTFINISGKQIELVGADYDTTNEVATQTLTVDETVDNSCFIVNNGKIAVLYIRQFDIHSKGNGNTTSHWRNMFKVFNGALYLYIGGYPYPSKIIVDYPILNVEDGFAFIRLKRQIVETNSTDSVSLIATYSAAKYIYTAAEIINNTNGLVNFPSEGIN